LLLIDKACKPQLNIFILEPLYYKTWCRGSWCAASPEEISNPWFSSTFSQKYSYYFVFWRNVKSFFMHFPKKYSCLLVWYCNPLKRSCSSFWKQFCILSSSLLDTMLIIMTTSEDGIPLILWESFTTPTFTLFPGVCRIMFIESSNVFPLIEVPFIDTISSPTKTNMSALKTF